MKLIKTCNFFFMALIITFFFSACAAQKPLLTTSEQRKKYEINESYQILPDRVIQGTDKFCVVRRDGSLENNYENEIRIWQPDTAIDLKGQPRFTAHEMPLLQSLFRMSQEEAVRNLRADGAFMAGAKWSGVWTRDISYAIQLSLGLLMNESSVTSLMAKTNALNQIIQDTGTGGSWPVSTDRMVWAVAAWEIYLVTGDHSWLEKAYELIKSSAEKDRITVFDPASGLYRGESSFTDWREQTYPKWMQPTDIFESQSLSTNVLHYRALSILSLMSAELNLSEETVQDWKEQSDALALAINNGFSLADKVYLGAYRYSPDISGAVSDKSDTLANSIAVLFGAVTGDEAQSIISDIPVLPFGPPIIFPQMEHAGTYHNKAIWPFVTAYYGLAGLSTGNSAAFDFSLRSNVRAAAMFLTHKENFVYNTGHWLGTAVNSDRQLWSIAGFQAQIIRGVFGINYNEKNLQLNPTVPEWIKGDLKLSDLRWRSAVLDITLHGTGNQIASLKVNGKQMPENWQLDYSASGNYSIDIVLEGTISGTINLQTEGTVGPRDVTYATIERIGSTVQISWPSPGDNLHYRVYKNGMLLAENLTDTSYTEEAVSGTPFYQLQSVTDDGITSNLSAPLYGNLPAHTITAQAEDGTWLGLTEKSQDSYSGYQGNGYIVIGKENNGLIQLQIPVSGTYLLRWRYANGNGPINTDNKAAIRSLYLNGRDVGTVVFAQTAGWSRWAWSNAIRLNIDAGKAEFELRFNPEDENMNLQINDTALDFLELIKM